MTPLKNIILFFRSASNESGNPLSSSNPDLKSNFSNCKICGRVCSNANLKRHMDSHFRLKTKKKLPCPQCSAGLATRPIELISFFLVKSRFQNCCRATGPKCFPMDTVRSIVKKQTEEYCISDLTWCLVVFTQKSHLKTHLEVHARNPARVPPASAANQIDPSSVANRQASLLINKVNKNNSLGLQTASITNPGKQSQQMQSCLMGLQ